MLYSENFDNLYTSAFALRKQKHWLNLSWDFLIGIKTKHHGMWYGMPVKDEDDNSIGFAIYDKAQGLPVIRYIMDTQRMENSSDYECESFMYQGNIYYFTFVNKSELKSYQEREWLSDYCDKHEVKCRGKRCYPSFYHLKPGFYPNDLNSMEEISFCETFVGALEELDRLLVAGKLMPQEGQCVDKIKGKMTLPLLIEQINGTWQLGKETLPPAGTLDWPRLLPNDFDTVRMKRFPKNGSTWQVEKFIHPMDDSTYNVHGRVKKLIENGIGVYVDALAVYDETVGHIMFMDNFFMRIEGQDVIIGFMTEIMEENGRPMKIIVGSEESYEFMKVFCQKLDIQLVMDEVPQLVTMRDNVLAGRNPMENFDDEEWIPADTSDDLDDFKHNDKKQRQGNSKIKCDKNVSKLSILVNNFLQEEFSGTKKTKQKAEAEMNAFLDKCNKYHYLYNISDDILESLLNMAMAFPIESKLFHTVVGEYQRRMRTGKIRFLAIFTSDSDD